jgi:hypothetical protein
MGQIPDVIVKKKPECSSAHLLIVDQPARATLNSRRQIITRFQFFNFRFSQRNLSPGSYLRASVLCEEKKCICDY